MVAVVVVGEMSRLSVGRHNMASLSPHAHASLPIAPDRTDVETHLDQLPDEMVRERDGRRGVALHVAQLLLQRLRVEEARDDVPVLCGRSRFDPPLSMYTYTHIHTPPTTPASTNAPGVVEEDLHVDVLGGLLHLLEVRLPGREVHAHGAELFGGGLV